MKFPLEIKKGSAVVKVYHTPSGKYDGYTVEAYANGERLRSKRATLAKARKVAKEYLLKISNGDIARLRVSSADVDMVARVQKIIEPTGKTLETVASEAAQLHTILGEVPPVEAARFFIAKNPLHIKPIKTPEAVEEMLLEKEQDRMSPDYMASLRKHLNKFAEHFNGPVMKLHGVEIADWLRALKKRDKESAVSPRTRNNFRTSINTFCEWCKTKGYLPRQWDEIEAVPTIKTHIGKIHIFTPEQLSAMLAIADPEKQLPFLLLGAFAGIRHREMQRLKWEHVKFDSGFIEINAESAKVQERRLVPVVENLAQWLTRYRERKGLVCIRENMTKQVVAVSKAAGVKWHHNALRHSFISYRVADTQNVAQVALEAGNSPRKIMTNYRELVLPSDAKKYFGITPENCKSVTNLSPKQINHHSEQ